MHHKHAGFLGNRIRRRAQPLGVRPLRIHDARHTWPVAVAVPELGTPDTLPC